MVESKSILPSNEVSAANKHFGRAAARKAATVNEVIIQDRLLFKLSRSWRLLVAPSRDPQARLSESRVRPRSLALSAVLCSLLCLTLLCSARIPLSLWPGLRVFRCRLFTALCFFNDVAAAVRENILWKPQRVDYPRALQGSGEQH